MTNHLVIGASGYIGSQIYANLKKENAKVIGTFFKNKKNDFLELDLQNIESIKKFISNLDLDCIDSIHFAHAALEEDVFRVVKKGEQLDSTNYELLNEFIKINSTSILILLQGLMPKLLKSKNPNIIFVGSLVGKKALNAPFAFSLGKSCLSGLVETLSKDLGAKNVKVNSVDPGMLKGGVSKFICTEDKEDYLKHCALERFGEAHEVANVCAWLGTKNTFITGKPFVLDGAL